MDALIYNKEVRTLFERIGMAEEVIIARETKNVSGVVQISGAKNSALKLIAASILGQGKSIIHNVPHVLTLIS